MKLSSAKIKQLRESKAWSQSHLAAASGVSLRTIQRIEKTGVASPESVKSLCATFEVHIDDIAIDQRHSNSNKILPGTGLLRLPISNFDKKAAIVSFVVAFMLAYVLTQ